MAKYILLSILSVLVSCQETDPTGLGDETIWTIDTEYLRRGCYDGQDCIPSLEIPERSEADGSDIDFLEDDDLIVGVYDGTDYVAYPHSILDWHEIVNETAYTISYCPLTGSAINIATDVEYGVSGLLYNSNLIMYDRETNSYWPQMLLRSASGDRSGNELHLNNLVETNWKNWRSLHADTKVINSNTGYSRNYSRYPYGGYRTCNSISCGDYIYFPVAVRDNSILAKERVLVIISGDSTLALQISTFDTPQVYSIVRGDKRFIAVVSAEDNIATAFETVREISIETWDIGNGEVALKDENSENRWNLLGQNLADIDSSNRLKAANAYIAYWFSVVAFFPEVELITG